jgi:Ribbon-helix-helix protein, copG family
MVRVQAQLTESQAARLRELAAERGVSVAELLRRGTELLLSEEGAVSREERRRRALSVVGRFPDTASDVATEHDRYLDDAYAP